LDEVFSGLVIVFALMLVVYGLDTAAARLKPVAGRVRRAAAVAGIATTLAGAVWIGWQMASDEDVDLAAVTLGASGFALALVALGNRTRIAVRLFPEHRDDGRFEVGLVMLLWLVIFQLVTYYAADESLDEVGVVAAAMQTLALLGVALAAVGFLTRRNIGPTLSRLGLDRLTPRAVWVGTLAVIPMLMFGALSVVLVDWLSPGSSERLADTVEQFTGGQTDLGYALAIGVFAAAGEETLFRGAIQPKYGLIFTTLVFALLHVQYDLLLVVASLFPVGLILGLERKYLGTWCCIITHALYNTLAIAAG
jgi:membrane protease YdiL (CAAX protease family)